MPNAQCQQFRNSGGIAGKRGLKQGKQIPMEWTALFSVAGKWREPPWWGVSPISPSHQETNLPGEWTEEERELEIF